MNRTGNNQLYALHLLVEAGLNTRHDRKQLTIQFSKGFKTNIKDLDELEIVLLISYLEKKLSKAQSDNDFEIGGYWRDRMIMLSIKYGFTKRNYKEGAVVFDMSKLDKWLLGNGFIKKKLIQYTHRELPFVVSQFETVVKDHLKTI